MNEFIDVVEEYGLVNLADVEYSGNFTVKYYSKEELELLQMFFGVRRTKFDMKLLEKRPEIRKVLEEYNYEKNSNSRNLKSI